MTENTLRPLNLPEGYAVETVYYGSGTVCISSQAGCRMGCPFCASGRAGLMRDLTVGEMLAQVDIHADHEVKRVTVSGIGEPLDNLDNVLGYMKESELPVSVTTAVPDIEKLIELLMAKHNGVMLSLHSGVDKTHKKLIPKASALGDIFDTMAHVWHSMSVNKRKKIGFNYMLLRDINDSDDELNAFINLVSPFREATVHLLVCNDVEKSRFESPDMCRFITAYEMMREAGLNVRRANSWRKSANGGCGTLFLKGVKNNIDISD